MAAGIDNAAQQAIAATHRFKFIGFFLLQMTAQTAYQRHRGDVVELVTSGADLRVGRSRVREKSGLLI
jgi:hypothetical protein